MKLVLLYLQTSKSVWGSDATAEYIKKISHFSKIEEVVIKSPSAARDDKDRKVKQETEKILKTIQPNDYLWLFDENGKEMSSSEEFSSLLTKALESGKSRLVFLIGGAYGVSEEIKERANTSVSLSKMTMNHHVAKTTALEQIYRGFCISKNIPYHNT